MSVFDQRHRWGSPNQQGSTITRVCSACGRIDTAEIVISDRMVDALMAPLMKPNPYRRLFTAAAR